MKKVIKNVPSTLITFFPKKRKSVFRGKGSTQYVKNVEKITSETFCIKANSQNVFFVICKKTTEVKHLLTLPLSNFNDLEGKCNFAGKGVRIKFLFSSVSKLSTPRKLLRCFTRKSDKTDKL